MNLPVGQQVGVLSTDLKAVFPNLVKGSMHPGNGKEDQRVTFDAVNYTALIPVLVQAVQELNAKTDSVTTNNVPNNTVLAQQAQIADLSRQLADLKGMLSDICNNGCGAFQINNASVTSAGVTLSQSIPNPATGSALIGYSISMPFTTASIQLVDGGGKMIRQFSLQLQQGAGSVTFDGLSVSAGTYSYSLIVDGKVYDTKSMVIVKE